MIASRPSLSLILLTFTAAACHDAALPIGPASPASPSHIASVGAESLATGERLRFAVNSPAHLVIQYWDTLGGPVLQLERDATDSSAAMVLTRLGYARTYRYSAFVESTMGIFMLGAAGTFGTADLPPDVASLQFAPSGTPGLTLVEVRGADGFNGFVAVDGGGHPVWYYRTQGVAQGSTQRANGHFVINDQGNGLRELGPDGTVIYSLPYGTGGATPHHDVVATPANTILFLSHDSRALPDQGTITGEAIYEWTPETGALVKRWSAWDWYDPSTDWGAKSYNADWLHANSLAIGPHGNILVSLNWLSQVASIAPDWSRLEWRLGGKTSDFSVDADASFSGQHAVSMPAEGRVLMFDNGRERTGAGRYSRGLELAIDTVSHRASVAWQFRPPVDIFAPYLGYARRLSDGTTLVHFGLNAGLFADQVATGPIATFGVTSSGTILSRLDYTGASSIYRARRIESIGGEQVIVPAQPPPR